MPTMDNSPGFVNSVEGDPLYDATGLRLLDTVDLLSDGDALSARPGVRPSAVEGFEPYVAGGTYTVSPGVAVVSKESDGAQGGYRVALSQAVIENVPAADAVNERKDVIYVRVFDNDVDGLGLREGQVVYDAGTPASVPTRPAVPADALYIADVDVPAAGQGNPTLVDKRVYTVASGGVLPTNSYPAQPYEGQAVYRRDTDTLEVYTSSGWKTYEQRDHAEATPVLDTNVISVYTDSPKVYRRNGMVTLTFEIQPQINWSTGWDYFVVPAGFRPPNRVVFSGSAGTTNSRLFILAPGGGLRTDTAPNAGQGLWGSVTYPAA